MQTIFIIIFAFVILVIGFIIIMMNYKANLGKNLEQHVVLDQMKRYQIINYLPYMKCSFDGVKANECIDKAKLIAFKNEVANNQLYYKFFFGFMKFSVKQKDALGNDKEEIIFENPKPEYTTKRQIEQSIIIYNPENRQYEKGVLFLEVYN